MRDHQSQDCHVEPLQKPLDSTGLSEAMAACLDVQGMGYPRCATRVNNGLLKLDGVLFSQVVLEQGMALVLYDPRRTTSGDLVRAVATAGNDGRHFYFAQVVAQIPYKELDRGLHS